MTGIQLNIIGVDEVGRGAWAGPLVCAAVRFREVPTIPDDIIIRDSKTLSPLQREKASVFIRKHADIAIVHASNKEIDRIGIQRANSSLFQAAVLKIGIHEGNRICADGRRICDFSAPHEFLVKGDQRCSVIAAASIIAKVWRDRLMARLGKKHPQYVFERNKGYGTPDHRAAIFKHGFSTMHRHSFNLSCYTSSTSDESRILLNYETP